MGKKRKASSNTLEIQNAAKTMLANIRFASVDSPMQSIVITLQFRMKEKPQQLLNWQKQLQVLEVVYCW